MYKRQLLDSFNLDYATSVNNSAFGVSATISLDDSTPYYSMTTGVSSRDFWGTTNTLDTGLDSAFTEAQRTLNNNDVVTFNLEFTDNTALDNQFHFITNMIVEGTVVGTAVPEPTSLALLGLGGLALVTRRKR